jgi:hypothetical protein
VSSSAPAEGVEARTRAVAARVEADQLWVQTADGRTLGVPISQFPWLAAATPDQRAAVRLYGGGYVLLWDQLDEAVSVLQLFGLPH